LCSSAITIKRGRGRSDILSQYVNVTGKALWYIETHLYGELSLEAISAAVYVSRFHLSRAFPAATGISLAAYVRGRRLSEAAKALVAGAPDILDVALSTGYGSHEAFTRAFRQLFGLAPEQLRAKAHLKDLKLWEPMRMNNPTITPIAAPRIIKSNPQLIFGLSQRYACDKIAGIPAQWNRFVPFLDQIPGQVGNTTYGVICKPDEAGVFDYICAVEVLEFPAHPEQFTRLQLPSRTYAVFEHRDHISSLRATMDYVWNEGMANSGYRAIAAPALEVYGAKFNPRTGLGGLEIWVPVSVGPEHASLP
jgi:AraC family transcriptional regulator